MTLKVIYFGTPIFAANVLRYLLQHGIDIKAVISKPDRPQGRSSSLVTTPVKCVAEAQVPPLPLFQPEIVSDLAFAPVLEKYQADLFVVVAYGEIIKQHLLEMPRLACINMHASLLPKYRGAAPIQWSIINGEKETGVTIMHMAKKMDAGNIISTKKVAIGPNSTYSEMEKTLYEVGSKLLLETIGNLEHGKTQSMPQDHTQATLAPKIELENCQIDWKKPAQDIHNFVRGVTPHPGAWCFIEVKGQQRRLKILSTRLVLDAPKVIPGQYISTSRETLLIGCGQGAVHLVSVQLEGKKVMAAEEFARGFPLNTIKFL